MNKIILHDSSKSTLIFTIGFFMLVLVSVPIFGIISYGLTIATLILSVCILTLIILTIIYFINHKAYIEIDSNGIAFFETNGLNKNLKLRWAYSYDKCIQVVVVPMRRSVGSPSNIQDCIDLTFIESLGKSKTIGLNIGLDAMSKSAIEKMKIEYNITNLIIK